MLLRSLLMLSIFPRPFIPSIRQTIKTSSVQVAYMSSQQSDLDKSNQDGPDANIENPETRNSESQNLGLPAPSDANIKIDVSGQGSTVILDHIGPVVVNSDGSLSRISNWHEMSEIERQNTMRIISKRNKIRRKQLEEAAKA